MLEEEQTAKQYRHFDISLKREIVRMIKEEGLSVS